jgi:hypothetical protein
LRDGCETVHGGIKHGLGLDGFRAMRRR